MAVSGNTNGNLVRKCVDIMSVITNTTYKLHG